MIIEYGDIMSTQEISKHANKRRGTDTLPNFSCDIDGSKAVIEMGQDSVFLHDLEAIGVDLGKASHKLLDSYARAFAYYRLTVLNDIPKKEAYKRIYGMPKSGQISGQTCYSLEQKRAYKHVAKAFSADYFIMFSAERIKMLNNLYNISMDEDVNPRDRVSAGDTFLKHTEVKNHELDPEQRDNQSEALLELFKGIETSIHKNLPDVGGTLDDIMVLPETVDVEVNDEQ